MGAEEAGLLGDVDPASQGGFLLGSAPLNARPAAPNSLTAGAPAGQRGSGGGSGGGALRVSMAGAGGAAAAGGGGWGAASPWRDGQSPLPASASPDESGPASPLSTGGDHFPGVSAPGSSSGGGVPLDLNTLCVKWKSGAGEGARLAAAVRERQQLLGELRRSVKVRAERGSFPVHEEPVHMPVTSWPGLTHRGQMSS